MRSSKLFLLATLAVGSVAPSAFADESTDVDLRSFRPSTDRRGSLATEPVETPGAWNLQFSQWLHFDTPSIKVVESDGREVRALSHRLVADPTVALGLGRRGAIGVTLPFVLYQAGEPSSLTDGRPMSSQGIGDVTLTGKATVFAPNPEIGGAGLGFVSRLSLPTGDRKSYVSDRGVIAEARVIWTYDLAHFVIVTATAGYRMRTVHHTIADLTIGDGVPWGATLALKPRGLNLDDAGKWTWMIESHGEIGTIPNKLFKTSRVSPVLVGASARYEFDKNLSLFGGIETGLTEALGSPRLRVIFGITYAPTIIDDDHDGVPDDVDECPGLPEDGKGAHPHDGCPDYEGDQTDTKAPVDTDGDGIPDDQDKCPNEPEDFDGVDDADGCPDPDPPPPPVDGDADGDGIPDSVDKCPDQPETINGYEDEDGCPESDKDGDTFIDAVDLCPNEPETFNGIDDEDGCPDVGKPDPKDPKKIIKLPPLLDVPPAKKDDKQPPAPSLVRAIKFDGSQPSKDSAADLRALGAWALAHPGFVLRISVKPEGKGDDAIKLSNERAKAVAEAVIRYAHTGGVAEAVTWDPKSKAKSNVALSVVVAPPPPPPKPITPPPPPPPPG